MLNRPTAAKLENLVGKGGGGKGGGWGGRGGKLNGEGGLSLLVIEPL